MLCNEHSFRLEVWNEFHGYEIAFFPRVAKLFANGGMGEKLKTGIGNVLKKEIMQIGKERVGTFLLKGNSESKNGRSGFGGWMSEGGGG